MGLSNFLKKFNERFSVKVFAIFTIFIVIICTTFTAFFIHHQSKSLTDNLIKKGEILARLLAHNSKLGVFSENEELLRDPIEGILQQEEVLEVLVFNLEGELLKKQQRQEIKTRKRKLPWEGKGLNKIFERLKESKYPIYLNNKDSLEFWATVLSRSGYSTEESLFFKEGPFQGKNRIIGFVGIRIDKEMLNKRLNGLLFNSILIGGIFLLLGAAVTYLVVHGITKPLKRLTEGVKVLGMGGSVEKIPVETEDEIGKLALAFNTMSESLKRREAEKEQLEKQLRHAQKMEAIGTLTGGIAHDFNNILNAIMGYASLLQIEMDENNLLRDDVEQILAATKRASNLTQSLLVFSRKQIMDARPVNLNKIIKDIEKMLARLIDEDIEFRVKLAEKDLIVMVDSGQIDQILFNFITNAMDAMPDGGLLTITTESVKLDGEFFIGRKNEQEKTGWYALIAVSDTGIGMDDKTRERIFDPFFTTKEVGKGTGLGLSMAYGIIKQHEGYIEVSSEPDKGTQFRIYLPIIESKIEDEKEEPLTLPRGGTETVLIAEDDEHIKELSKDILERSGYKVIDAVDGEDAVRKFMENMEQIQFLLFDVIMPKKNGKDAYKEIKKMKPGIKTLFFSGYDHNVIHKTGILDEGINIIYKPVSSDMLLRKVRELLDT